MLLKAFGLSYLFSSVVTFITDIFYPETRVDRDYPSGVGGTKDVPDHTLHVIDQYYKIMKVTLLNVASSVPLFIVYQHYSDGRENDNPFIYNFLMWLMITDVSFFIFHYSLHHPKLYHLHKLHHQYRYTYGPAALYSSLSEFYLSNVLPNLISFEVLQLSTGEMVTIIIFQTCYTVIVSHGGYKFSKDGHLKHHLQYKEPYGIFLSDDVYRTKWPSFKQ